MITEILNYLFATPIAQAQYAATDVTAVTTSLTAMITAYLPSLLLLAATLAIARVAYGWVKGAVKSR